MNKYAYCIKENIIKIINTETGKETNITAEKIEELTSQDHFASNIRDYLIHTIKTLEKITTQLEDLYLKDEYKEDEKA